MNTIYQNKKAQTISVKFDKILLQHIQLCYITYYKNNTKMRDTQGFKSYCHYQRYPNEGSWFKCDANVLFKKYDDATLGPETNHQVLALCDMQSSSGN